MAWAVKRIFWPAQAASWIQKSFFPLSWYMVADLCIFAHNIITTGASLIKSRIYAALVNIRFFQNFLLILHPNFGDYLQMVPINLLSIFYRLIDRLFLFFKFPDASPFWYSLKNIQINTTFTSQRRPPLHDKHQANIF